MKSLLNTECVNDIINRINALEDDDKRLWGKMTVNEMVCHLADSLRMATGELKTEFVGNFISTTLLKQLVFWGMPAPKGKVKTVNELKQGVGGTKPTTFKNDKELLKKLIINFSSIFPGNEMIVHPVFGKMTKAQWGRLIFIHVNYHLQQFSR